jgi:hypothetical protein
VRRVVTLLAVAACAVAPPAHAAGPKTAPVLARATLVRGEVQARAPWAWDWRPVRDGEVFREGDLIRIGSNAALSLRLIAQGRFAGFTAKNWDLILTEPAMVRVSAEELRDLRMALEAPPKVIDDGEVAEEATDADAPKDDGAEFDDFTAAWRGALQSMTTGARRMFGLPPPAASENGGISVQAQDVRIRFPPDDAVVQVDELPAKVPLAWQGAAKTYQVWTWSAAAPTPRFVARTAASTYTLTLDEAGEHFIDIRDARGRSTGRARRVYVTLKEPSAAGGDPAVAAAPRARVVSPPLAWTLTVPGDQAAVDFVIDGAPEAMLVVTAEGRPWRRVRITGGSIRLVLPAGRYEWALSAGTADGASAAPFAHGDLRIDRGAKDDWPALAARALREKTAPGTSTHYLDFE